MVEAVIVFGNGVAGLSVLTHTHTLPTILLFTPRADILLSMPVLNTHALPIRILSVVCSSTRRGRAANLHAGAVVYSFVPTHRLLSGLVSCSQERRVVSTAIHIFLMKESTVF